MLSLSKYLKTQILIIVSVFLFRGLDAQNLITNGSFELYNAPTSYNNWGGGFFDYSVFPAHRILLNWDEYNSSDFYLTACTNTFAGVPINRMGNCYAKDGNNYVGFMLFDSDTTNNLKEYIYQQLQTPLQSGKIYCLTFFISRADRKEYAIKNIGALFSMNAISSGTLGYINAVPQVENQAGILTDTVQWTEIQGCFTAQGGEQYMTIGNFNSDSNTSYFYAGTNNPVPSNPAFAYYYIDDITLTEQTMVGLRDLSNLSEVVEVYPNPTNGIINIDIKNYYMDDLKIRLTDLLGKEVMIEAYKKQFDISFLEKGIYFISVHKGSEILVTEKVIKN